MPIGDAWLLTAGPEDVSPTLIRQVLHPKSKSLDFEPASVLAWDVDWGNFLDEYPWIEGTAEAWKQRLALALERSFHAS
ncbi:hypothetical protein ACIA58_26315 [Kribbella sp. NPDC051586]|uniref:hypothetical protein n=1 Tax=Kribbella sp. NPDC051586 TaxID=3364118 RepID=UPI0037B21BBB